MSLDQIEVQIAALTKELGHALYPTSREEFVEGMLNVSPEIAKMQKIDTEWRRNNQAQMWLEFLEDVKREKDKNSAQWRRMCNMD